MSKMNSVLLVVDERKKIQTIKCDNLPRYWIKSWFRVYLDIFLTASLLSSVAVWIIMLFNIDQIEKFSLNHPWLFLSGLGATFIYLIGLLCFIGLYLPYRDFRHQNLSRSIVPYGQGGKQIVNI